MSNRRKDTPNPDPLSSDDELFVREVGEVKRVHHKQAPILNPRSEGPLPLKAGEPVVENEIESGEGLRFLRPGIQTATYRKLRRGHFPAEATLDLHGFTQTEARQQLERFLVQSQARGRRCVHIVHGKGHGSPGQPPILKSKTNQWLREFPAVLAFCSAHPRDGGTGAVDVLLRK